MKNETSARPAGEVLRDDFMIPQRISVSDLAHYCDVGEEVIEGIIAGSGRIDDGMARKLGKAFGNGADFWKRLRLSHYVATSPEHTQMRRLRAEAQERQRRIEQREAELREQQDRESAFQVAHPELQRLYKDWQANNRIRDWEKHLLTEHPIGDVSEEAYRHTHKDVLRRALLDGCWQLPASSDNNREFSNTVSCFSSWVHSLYQLPLRNSQEHGRQGEEQFRLRIDHAKARYSRPPVGSDWKIIHNGIGPRAKENAKRISRLRLSGKPLMGSPDVVYRSDKALRTLIVEIKTLRHDLPVPKDGWPDLRAQLWAYSNIDEFTALQGRMSLVALVITSDACGQFRARALLPFDPADDVFQQQSCELFEAYGGEFVCKDGRLKKHKTGEEQ